MFKGVYKGCKSDLLTKKILILGESHYENDTKIENTFNVVNDFLNDQKKIYYKFFRKIAETLDEEVYKTHSNYERVWDYVYFGNYVSEICGIRNGRAKELVNKNREVYNNELFKFINENDIDIVFVFSRLTYNHLPSLSKKGKEKEKQIVDKTLKVGNVRDYINCSFYLPNIPHRKVDVILNKELAVYSMRHPSAAGGYNIDNYYKYLNPLFERLKNDLCNI